MNIKISSLAFVVSLLPAPFVHAHSTPHWSYSGAGAPEKWGKLSQDFASCEKGYNQSPVDIQQVVKGELPPLSLTYQAKDKSIINNGHTLQLNVHDGDKLLVDGTEFTLLQFHFHTPSENQINGKAYPLELHFVHSDDKGNLAVVGVMFEQGKANPAIADILKMVPATVNVAEAVAKPVSLADLMPGDKSYFRFSGSLTTPPCTEGVRWLVMKQPVTLSADQIDAFKKILGDNNSRPVQPLNGRVIIH